MRVFICVMLIATAALLASTLYRNVNAQAFNPSEVPPWGTGPNPNGTPNVVGNPPVSISKPAQPVQVQPAPAVPTFVVPTGSDKFSLYKSDGTSVDVTDKVFLFLDQKTGGQFIMFVVPGTGLPVMVKR